MHSVVGVLRGDEIRGGENIRQLDDAQSAATLRGRSRHESQTQMAPTIRSTITAIQNACWKERSSQGNSSWLG